MLVLKKVLELFSLMFSKVFTVLSAFFMSNGKINPPYTWITIFLIPVAFMLYFRVYDIYLGYRMTGRLDVPLDVLSAVLVFVLGWLAVYNWDRKNRVNPIHTGENKDETIS